MQNLRTANLHRHRPSQTRSRRNDSCSRWPTHAIDGTERTGRDWSASSHLGNAGTVHETGALSIALRAAAVRLIGMALTLVELIVERLRRQGYSTHARRGRRVWHRCCGRYWCAFADESVPASDECRGSCKGQVCQQGMGWGSRLHRCAKRQRPTCYRNDQTPSTHCQHAESSDAWFPPAEKHVVCVREKLWQDSLNADNNDQPPSDIS